MDRSNWTSYNTYHYYSQPYPEDGQHTFQPETGQTSAGGSASWAWESDLAPGQPYLNFNWQAQTPSSFGPDMDCLLPPPQPIAVEDISQNDALLEAFSVQPAAPARRRKKLAPVKERFLAGLEAYERGASLKDCSATLLFRDYIRCDGGLTKRGEALYGTLTPAEKTRVNQAIASRKERLVNNGSIKERFLAGLDKYAQGVPLKNCSATLQYRSFVTKDGRLTIWGEDLRAGLSQKDQERVNQALLSRNRIYREREMDNGTVEARFLAGLDNYARGVQMDECSATLAFGSYLFDDGYLRPKGQHLRDSLPQGDQERIDEALLARREISLNQAMDNAPIEERFLATLDAYASGVPIISCSRNIFLNKYVTDDGYLQPERGQSLYNKLSQDEQTRVDQALLSRREISLKHAMDNASVEERLLAILDDYASGESMTTCSKNLSLGNYISCDGYLQPGRGVSLYNKLDPDDKQRVDQALAARGRIITQQTSKDVDRFMATLEPYSNGLPLKQCGKPPGLKRRVTTYLTSEGGLTPRGKRLIENLSPSQRSEVSEAITKRQRRMELNPQVSEPPLLWPDMLSPMPELGGMNQAEMTDPIQVVMNDSLQTEAMWATVWQLTGQAAPGTWGIPAESAGPSVPYYDSEAVGADFQH
ncbi:MAG: hypothetical protein P8X74_13275 [Reinekea sp.]